MYLAPEGDELELASAAADFIADALPIARLHEGGGPDMGAELRATLGAMGWFALALPEDLVPEAFGRRTQNFERGVGDFGAHPVTAQYGDPPLHEPPPSACSKLSFSAKSTAPNLAICADLFTALR